MSNKVVTRLKETSFPGDHSRLEPPDPIPNSVVKQSSADDSVGSSHVKVGHRQVFFFSLSAGIAQQVEQLTCNQ